MSALELWRYVGSFKNGALRGRTEASRADADCFDFLIVACVANSAWQFRWGMHPVWTAIKSLSVALVCEPQRVTTLLSMLTGRS
jgi:hypothetical protein